MRPIIIKDKYICKENIESYKDFTIEDSYFIKEENDGFKIDGKIKLRGIVVYKDDEENLEKDIDINILLPYEKLESRNMIKIILNKVDYSKNENILLIKIKLKVVGDEEVKENFMFNERKMEFPPKEENIEVLDTNLIKSMEDIFKNDGVEMVSTLEEEKKENSDIFDVRVEEEIETLPLVIEETPVVEEKVDLENNNEKSMEINKKEELLKTEYVPTFFFYRVKDKENLDEILNRYHMNLEEFKKLNNKIEVKENDLIQIKLR